MEKLYLKKNGASRRWSFCRYYSEVNMYENVKIAESSSDLKS